MSSAILYLAIVAIWAVVLIPRWLHRDSPASGRGSTAEPGAAERPGAVPRQAEPASGRAESAPGRAEPAPGRAEPAPGRAEPAPGRAESAAAASGEQPGSGSRPRDDRPVAELGARAAAESDARAAAEPPVRPGPGDDRRGPRRDLGRRRLMSARRRVLGMLLVLTAGSGALAAAGMAAWWVMVPPSVLLLGYLPLLRAAARADGERLGQAGTRLYREAAGAAVPFAAAAAQGTVVPSGAAPTAARPAPPPDAEVIDISASVSQGGEFYDQRADARLRAVGD